MFTLDESRLQLQPRLFVIPLSALHGLSLPQAGVGEAAAQPAEAHVAASQRPIPGVSASPHEGHAADRERAVIGTAPPGGGDEEERPGTFSNIVSTVCSHRGSAVQMV